MTDREALQIAFNALKSIDAETPYPIAKHAIKCINAAFSTPAQPEQEPVCIYERNVLAPDVIDWKTTRTGTFVLYEAPPSKHEQEPIGYADKYDIERKGHDFWVSREPGKDTVPIYVASHNKEDNT